MERKNLFQFSYFTVDLLPKCFVIGPKSCEIAEKLSELTHFFRRFDSIEDYEKCFAGSNEGSHLLIFVHPQSPEQVEKLFLMDRVRKIIVQCEEAQRKSFDRIVGKQSQRCVVLRQTDLALLSALLNFSRMLTEAGNRYRDLGQDTLAVTQYEIALNLQLKASEILRKRRSATST